MNSSPVSKEIDTEERKKLIFEDQMVQKYIKTDRFFAVLMVIQWVAAIFSALVVSPRTWAGTESQIHLHVWAAIFTGGTLTTFVNYLVWTQPGKTVTRFCIAVAQMLFSSLLVQTPAFSRMAIHSSQCLPVALNTEAELTRPICLSVVILWSLASYFRRRK